MTIREIKENELGELLELYTHLHELDIPKNNEHLQKNLGSDYGRQKSSYHCL